MVVYGERGGRPDPQERDCPQCRGSGVVLVWDESNSTRECPECRGRGARRIVQHGVKRCEPCDPCDGTGRVADIPVRVP